MGSTRVADRPERPRPSGFRCWSIDNIRYPGTRRRATAPRRAPARPRTRWPGATARAADALGVDIIEKLRSDRIRRDASGAVEGVADHAGARSARRASAWPGGPATPAVIMKNGRYRAAARELPAAGAGVRAVKPVFPCWSCPTTIHAYISQSDKGELVIGAGTDAYTSYTQRGGPAYHQPCAGGDLRAVSHVSSALRMLRAWGGIVDVDPRPLAHHCQDTPGPGVVRELRLGHRRFQGPRRVRPMCLLDHRRAR